MLIKKIIITILSIAFGLGLFFWLIGLAGVQEIVNTFLHISIWWSLLFLLISVIIDLMVTLRWQILIKYHGYKTHFWDLVKYRLMGYAVSYITPTAHIGGEPFKAILLKEQGVPTTTGLSTVFLDRILEFTAALFFGTIGMFMVLVSFKAQWVSWILMLVAFIVTVFLDFKFYAKLNKEEKMFISLATKFGLMRFGWIKSIVKKIDEVEVAMSRFMSGSKRGMIIVLSMSGIMWTLMFCEYGVALKMVGHNGTLVQIFLIGVFIGLSYLVPVPGAIGSLEGGQLSLFKLMGQSASLGLVFGLVIRGRDMLRTFVGVIFLSISGVGWFGKKKPHKK